MQDQQKSQPHRWTIRLIVYAIVLALLVVFIAQNFEHVTIRVLAWNQDIRLGWALLIAVLLGFVLGWLLPRLRH